MSNVAKYTLSAEAKTQRQDAARKHAIYAFESRGVQALDSAQVERLVELRQMLADAPGRTEFRRELTARMALICELGFAHLREQTEVGQDIWQGGIIGRLATYVAETRRLLDSFEDDIPRGTAAELISQAMSEDGQK